MAAKQNLSCEALRESVVSFMAGNTFAMSAGGACVITLPVLTVDGRWSDVFIESRMKNSLIVHDNGKAFSEMFMHGLSISDKAYRDFSDLAHKYAIHFSREKERFETLCETGKAQDAIVRVATCSAVATRSLLEAQSVDDEDSAIAHVRIVLDSWIKRHKRKDVKITENTKMEGASKQHVFEFALHLADHPTTAISVLSPTVSAINTAERFGFKIQDLRNARAQFRSVAVRVKRAGGWSKSAIKIIDHFSDLSIPVDLKQRSFPAIEQDRLDRLIAA